MNFMHDHSPRTPKSEWSTFAHYERRISNAKDITAETLAYFNQQGNKSVMIKFILSLPPDQRTPEMIEKLYTLTKDLKFFIDIREEHTEDIHYSCCKYLYFENYKAGSIIIKQGEPGSKFYIIIEGKASVIRENSDDSITLIAEIGDGESFGERSLLLGTLRAATVIATDDCALGVLTAGDYKKILESFMEDRYNVLIDMLRHLPMFKNQSLNYLHRFTYYFKSKKAKKRQVIFQEGDIADEVYLIQEGEFSLFKAFTISITSSRPFPENSPLKTKNISKQSPISILSKGTMFGEEEITSGENRRNTTCICTSNHGLLLVISKENFQKHIMKNDDAIDFIKNRTQKKLQTRQNVFDKKIKIQKLNSGAISLEHKNDKKNIESLPQLASPMYASIKKVLSPRTMINSSTLLLSNCKESDEKGLIYSNKRHESLSTIITSDISEQSMPKLHKNENKFNFSTISTSVKESLNSRRQNSQFSNISAYIGEMPKIKNLCSEEDLNSPVFSSFLKETDPKSPKTFHSSSISFDKKWCIDTPSVKISNFEDNSPKQRISLGAELSQYPYLYFTENSCRKLKKEPLINIHTHLMKSKSKKYHKFNSYYKAAKEKIHFLNEQDLSIKKL